MMKIELTPIEALGLLRILLLASDEARCEGNETIESVCQTVSIKIKEQIDVSHEALSSVLLES